MTAEELEMYREVLSDHAAHPRNFRELADATSRADGHNKMCGDKFTVWVKVESETIRDIAFQGTGCSISTSSASLMTDAIKGKTIAEANEVFRQFHSLLTSPAETEIDLNSLGKLAAFHGVRKYPIRVKCATLPWHTMQNAIDPRRGTKGHEEEKEPQMNADERR